MGDGQGDAAKHIQTSSGQTHLNSKAITRVWKRFERMDRTLDTIEMRLEQLETNLVKFVQCYNSACHNAAERFEKGGDDDGV